MKSKSNYLRPAASLMAAVLTYAGCANAATIVVPTDYPTIQAAVDAAAPGDTIAVDPGNYVETVTVNTNLLTIKGAQAGVSGVGRAVGPANESNLDGEFHIQAADVTIDGFSITHSVTISAAFAVVVHSGGDGALVTNNVIDTVTTTADNTAQGIYLEGGPGDVEISSNSIKNVSSNRSAKGILLGANGDAPPTNALIKGNTISNVTSTIKGAYGIGVANASSAVNGLVIEDNWISNLSSGGWVHAIGLEGNTPSVLVTGNDISSLTAPVDSEDNIAVWFEVENASFSTAEVHDNNFSLGTASYGIKVSSDLTGPGAVDGTCNWWNKATGPTIATNAGGTGTRVSAKVTYSPWLNAQAPLGICVSVITNKNQAKGDGWKTLIRKDGTSFKNQGDAIQYLKTGK